MTEASDLISVDLPSGSAFEVLTDEEADYVEQLSTLYMAAFEFTHVSDIQDLDQLIMLELQIWRWQRWASRTMDYAGEKVDQTALHKRVKEASSERRQLKKSMGVDALSREKAKGEGSVPHFISRLKTLAKLFGIHRETQLDRALELTNQLIGLVTVWKNCVDDDERRQLHHTTEDIMRWILEVYMPEYQQIDEHFRNRPSTGPGDPGGQRYWIREI